MSSAPSREPLSVVVITLDEERDVERCLDSVAWADELVVVDAGSTDRTRELAACAGARVVEQAWLGYAEQKNFAVEQARHDWVLSLDADEWLTPEGSDELRRVLAAPTAEAYALNRRNAFCGAFLRGAWTPDWQVRLFRRDRGRFGGGAVHESVQLQPGCRVERLRERLQHEAYASIGEYLRKLDRYTALAAESLHARGARFAWRKLLFSPPLTLLKVLLLKRAYRDGVRGWIIAAGSAFYVLLKQARLWELEREAQRGPGNRRDADA